VVSEPLVIGALAVCTAAVGALGGLGGAVLLVPLLVVLGLSPVDAAPLGLLSVAAASLAAASGQLIEGTVNHRIGVSTEIAASAGAIAGAFLSDAASEDALTYLLALTALGAAVASGRRRGVRNPPQSGYAEHHVGEWPGALAGAYRVGGGVAPYRARRLPLGLAAVAASGVFAGLAGASGGFIKTPAVSELMHIPVKVAASTTMFTVGVTSATALLVFAVQGRVDAHTAAPVLAGALIGGSIGVRVQKRLPPPVVRRATSVLLVLVAVVLVVR
jgi:uncharacterized protein